MKKSILREKSFLFALEIVQLYKFLSKEKREYVLSKQLLGSATSVGANIREAQNAQSPKTLFTNLPFLKRNVMNHCMGLNYYIARVMYQMRHSKNIL